MTKNITLVAIAVAGLFAVQTASAQTSPVNGLSARVGAFFPTGGAAKAESKTWLAVGLQYKVRELSIAAKSPTYKAHLAVSVDFYNRNDYRVVPVLVNYVGELNEKLFYTAGAGLSFSRKPSGGGTSQNTNFAYTLGVGYNLTSGATPVFVEGRFFGNDDSSLNGYGLFVGVRF